MSTALPFSLDKVIGALMIGSWVNSILYVLEWVEVYRYYQIGSKDSIFSKLTVGAALAVDTVSVAANYGIVYGYCVTHLGEPSYIFFTNGALYLYVITTGVTAFITQTWLIFRCMRACVHSTKQYIVSILMALTAGAALAGCIVTTFLIIKYPNAEERHRVINSVTLWLVASACVDVAVAMTLLWQLRTMTRTSAFQKTRSVITRISRITLQTGTLTSLLAVLVLVTFLADKASNVTIMFGYILSRCYTLTLLYNLNLRSRIVGHGSDANSGGLPGHGHGNRPQTRPYRTPCQTESLGGIHVHRTAIVRIDEGTGAEDTEPRPSSLQTEDLNPSVLYADKQSGRV
ncbi:hypothetical protein FB45DRAFT_1084982 [Roridomyces roridus]|uniref:DUF6534 domain-containing protein n=1 Tax=Roridomyces roridus TaxID=1738132 RepID=A0AAD7FLS8_9AGAR|nr:hypothetical protein FB45DRAFT_1084982 [Roridomyces roridus]